MNAARIRAQSTGSDRALTRPVTFQAPDGLEPGLQTFVIGFDRVTGAPLDGPAGLRR